MFWSWIFLGAAALLVALVALGWRHVRDLMREIRTERARELFRLQREHLEAKFFDLASHSGKPRGLSWSDVEWGDKVKFVRDRRSGDMVALVGITIQFEAVVGGGMEENPNVGNLRDATAVFNFYRSHWITQGRALFNMNPDVAIHRYHDQYEPVPTRESRS